MTSVRHERWILGPGTSRDRGPGAGKSLSWKRAVEGGEGWRQRVDRPAWGVCAKGACVGLDFLEALGIGLRSALRGG